MDQHSFILFCFLSISLQATTSLSPALILTPYIERNELQHARNLSRVDSTLFLNVTSHTGFFTVDKNFNSNMFFWYFPVVNKPINETPWIIWLQGGPGASSLDGLFDEIGPFQYDEQLKFRNHSWTSDYSVLFIDNPIGSGYSFTNNDSGYPRDFDTISNQLKNTIMQFVKVFPELRNAPLYIAGESYAGHYIPHFANTIVQSQKNNSTDIVNLQGLIMGNPVFNRESIQDYSTIYYNWGLIDAQGRQAVQPLQDDYIKALKERNPDKAASVRDDLLDKLMEISFQTQMFNMLDDDIDLKDFIEFLNKWDVSDALHVGNLKFTYSSNTVKKYLAPQFFDDAMPVMEKLLDQCRVLIYCGQLDMVAPCVPSAIERRRRWHWSLRDDFLQSPRKPWWYNESVAGYVKSGGKFTEVLVRGAGHLVPRDKPAQALQLIDYFIRGLDLPLPPNYNAAPDDTPDFVEPELESSSKTLVSMIVSVVINVILILAIATAVVYFLRWKQNNEAFFYSTTEDSISDGILTMS